MSTTLPMSDDYGSVMGGKLKLGKKKKMNKRKLMRDDEAEGETGETSNELNRVAKDSEAVDDEEAVDDGLTDTQRRHKQRLLDKEKAEISKFVAKTHRQRVEEYNIKLANMTEHNDLPRVSAAGNG